MPFKDLEHDGGEVFQNVDNRNTVKLDKIMNEIKITLGEDERKKKAQEQWLSPNNPYLWMDID